MEDQRLLQLTHWARAQPTLANAAIRVASADASFRRYFRICGTSRRYILMDAPPDKEDTAPFLDVTQRLEAVGLPVPHVYQQDLEQGFLMLSDFGDVSLLATLSADNVDHWYSMALDQLLPLQSADTLGLPVYDHALLMREMALFPEWFLQRHLGITLTSGETATLNDVFETLATSARQQPTAFVHRDYHSRNLMVVDNKSLGIIDFQDAVLGPVTYDAVSLLRDCYVHWPQQQVQNLALSFKRRLEQAGNLRDCDEATFLRWFDLMGTQRHLKAIGIFARLNHRDGKPGYLGDIPRTLGYVMQVARRHEKLAPLAALLEDHDIEQRLSS